MSHTPHTETDENTGITLKIILDEGGTDQPHEDDESTLIAIYHARYINPAEKRVIYIDHVGYDLAQPEQAVAFKKRCSKPGAPWFVFDLFAYDHSGVVYRVSDNGNPFSCPWDSSQAGIVAIHKRDWYGDEKRPRRAKALVSAKSIADEYSAWASGEVYGYVIEDTDGEVLDSCWGFIGSYDGYVLEEGRQQLLSYVEGAEEIAAAREVQAQPAQVYQAGV